MSNQTIPARPIIAFMTDFGSADGNVGVMKGVALGIAPEAQIVDITHDIAAQNIASGAWILAVSYRYFPRGTVFICVVDPGVGSARRPIAVHAGEWYFVGPDNGLFSYIYAEQVIRGSVMLSNPDYQLQQVSSTFHGRDIFSPAGAHITRGVSLSELGQAVEPAELLWLEVSSPIRQGNLIHASVVHIDHFGNLITGIPLGIVPDLFSCTRTALTFSDRGVTVSERRRFFADSSGDEEAQPFIYEDSSGYVGVAVRNGNAGRVLGVGYGSPVTLMLVV